MGVFTKASDFNVEGIGKNFILGVIDFRYIDVVFQVRDENSFETVDRLLKEERSLAGSSSGAVITVTLKYSNYSNTSENIVTILPDTGLKYFSKLTVVALVDCF